MKKFLLLCFAALFSSSVFAQNVGLLDVVHLKNGSIIRGTVIEQVPGESIKIETRDGNVFVYKMEEIGKMTREISQQTRSRVHNQPTKYNRTELRYQTKSKARVDLIETGYGFGVGELKVDRFNFNFINGYQFNPYLAIGLGVGFRYYSYGDGANKIHESTIPVFAHIRANCLNRGVSPFFAFNIGYNAPISGDSFKGITFGPTLGTTIRISDNHAITFGISCTIDQRNYDLYAYNYIVENYLWQYHKADLGVAIDLKLGFTF